VRGSSSQLSILPLSKTTVAQFQCTAYTPCTDITLTEVTLTDKAGRTGKLECDNAINVSIDSASSPSGCARKLRTIRPFGRST
jgi:hypothetical protein